MGARTRYRKRALDIMFESEARSGELDATLADRIAVNEPPISPYTIELVEGVVANRARIDALLSEHAQGWTLQRMPAVDRNVLRLGAYEILYNDDVPDPVAVSEAVQLAEELSTDDSPRFVAGLLGRIIDLKPTLTL